MHALAAKNLGFSYISIFTFQELWAVAGTQQLLNCGVVQTQGKCWLASSCSCVKCNCRSCPVSASWDSPHSVLWVLGSHKYRLSQHPGMLSPAVVAVGSHWLPSGFRYQQGGVAQPAHTEASSRELGWRVCTLVHLSSPSLERAACAENLGRYF